MGMGVAMAEKVWPSGVEQDSDQEKLSAVVKGVHANLRAKLAAGKY